MSFLVYKCDCPPLDSKEEEEMAKNKIGKGVGHRDEAEMTKSQLKAYHKEICEFYEEHGWRTTLSQYLLSPKQAGPIVEGVRAKADKAKAKAKAEKAKARAAKKAEKAAKKKTGKANKATSKKKAPPRKKPSKNDKAAPKKKAAKKKTTERKTATAATAPASASQVEATLDYLLAYRKKKGEGVSLDTAIADLATKVRAS